MRDRLRMEKLPTLFSGVNDPKQIVYTHRATWWERLLSASGIGGARVDARQVLVERVP